MPIAKSEFISRISLGNVFAVREGRTVTKWTVVAVCGLLAVCAEIGEAAARGRYSNFGPWSSNHSQATEISATRRPNEHGAAKPLRGANGHHRPMFHGHPCHGDDCRCTGACTPLQSPAAGGAASVRSPYRAVRS